jgi:hypothetical protein
VVEGGGDHAAEEVLCAGEFERWVCFAFVDGVDGLMFVIKVDVWFDADADGFCSAGTEE